MAATMPSKEADAVISSKSSQDVASDGQAQDNGPPARKASALDVLVQGAALFSDGYNIQIIGYMNSVLAKLYPKEMTTDVKTRLSNSILIGDVFGMIIFGLCIDRFGRKIGIILTTVFLVVVSHLHRRIHLLRIAEHD